MKVWCTTCGKSVNRLCYFVFKKSCFYCFCWWLKAKKDFKKEKKMKNKFNDFFNAWEYLITTDVFWHENLEETECLVFRDENGELLNNKFLEVLDIHVVKVNPKTNAIDDNESLNTKTQIWLESGEPYTVGADFIKRLGLKTEFIPGKVYYNAHCPDYDSGGDTFEKAIIEMANNVWRINKR